jgi:hypothetical protein
VQGIIGEFFNRFVVNLCFLLNSGQSAPGPIEVVPARLLHAQKQT